MAQDLYILFLYFSLVSSPPSIYHRFILYTFIPVAFTMTGRAITECSALPEPQVGDRVLTTTGGIGEVLANTNQLQNINLPS